MRDIFYGILSVILIGIFYFTATEDRYVNLNHKEDGIIIQITDDVFIGKIVYIQTPDDSIHHYLVYEIAVKDLEVGDTIKVEKDY